eukprot:1193852-Prorocentrum_minimum.AAC.2
MGTLVWRGWSAPVCVACALATCPCGNCRSARDAWKKRSECIETVSLLRGSGEEGVRRGAQKVPSKRLRGRRSSRAGVA